jgi:hypothetical protein
MADDEGSDAQLISFLLYAILIYPVANYLMQRRDWPQMYRIAAAVGFLGLIASLQIAYENSIAGPNHYALMSVTRGDSIAVLKRAHRQFSLELHPDKIKDKEKNDLFLVISHAYEVISDQEKRKWYEILGDGGVKAAEKTVIDYNYIATQMMVHYTSTAVFAFIMTISDTGSGSMAMVFFALSFILLIESLLVLERWSLPTFLFPYTTAHDFVSLLRRLFPAFMHGCRTVLGSLYVDEKQERVILLNQVVDSARATVNGVSTVVHSEMEYCMRLLPSSDRKNSNSDINLENGIVQQSLNDMRDRIGHRNEILINEKMKKNILLIETPTKLRTYIKGSPGMDLLQQGGMLIIARLLLGYIKTSPK